jgi:hypothetical protein
VVLPTRLKKDVSYTAALNAIASTNIPVEWT